MQMVSDSIQAENTHTSWQHPWPVAQQVAPRLWRHVAPLQTRKHARHLLCGWGGGGLW